MNMQYKQLIPSIYLLDHKAVRSLTDHEVISEDPEALACEYNTGFADALMIFDLSDDDAMQEAHNDIIRAVCASVRIPVIGAGRVRRLEDVKKLLYAGCAMAALNLSHESNAALAGEAAARFGADKIAGCYSDPAQVSAHAESLRGNISLLIEVRREGEGTKAPADGVPVPVIREIGESECVKEVLKDDRVNGVTGPGVNRRAARLEQIREKLDAAGISVYMRRAQYPWSAFKKGPDGLVPVVVQEDSTDQVLMVAYMNQEAYERTVRTGRMTYWSRSRQELWVKGLTSGHLQFVHSLTADCDMDTILARVDQVGAACHTGSHSCFFNGILSEEGTETFDPGKVLQRDYETIVERRDNPKEGSYTNYLFDKGLDKMLKKLGEESAEIIIAAKNPNPNEIVYEIADYLYHMMVVMAQKDLTWEDVTKELARRQKKE